MASLTNFVKTTRDAQAMLLVLDGLLQELFKRDVKSAFDASDVSKNVKTLLEGRGVEVEDKLAVEQALGNLKKEIQGLTPVKLVVGFSMPTNFVGRVFDWFRDNVSSSLVLDIKKDEKLLGGVIIMYKGRYQDLSLLKKLDAFLESGELNVSSK
jgi:hypothetical protein